MIYRIGNIDVDTVNLCLFKNGSRISLEPQSIDLIVYLITNRKRLVTRQELFDTLWAGRDTADATLSNHIKNARQALGDDGQRQGVIKTLHGRGYQFVAEIEEITDTSYLDDQKRNFAEKDPLTTAQTRNQPGLFVLAIACLAILATLIFSLIKMHDNHYPVKSIAVLPFDNRSNLEEDEFFTDGIHDDLTTQISKIHELKTISRTSVMAYRNTEKNLRTIGNELGVNAILEGGVQRAGDQIRINVQLIDTKTDTHLWAKSYTRKLTVENIFFIQSEITESIANELQTVLTREQRENIEKIPTRNIAALEAYFLAKASGRKNTTEGFQEAITHLHQAISIDPNFAIAYAELASYYLAQIYWAGLPAEQQIAVAEPLIEKALQLDDTISATYVALGDFETNKKNYSAAERAFDTAIKLNPSNADAFYAYGLLNLWSLRNIPKAVSLLTTAKELNPKDDKLGETLAQALIASGQFNEARSIVEDIISRKPNYAAAYKSLCDIEFYGGHNIADAIRAFHKNIELDPGVPSNSLYLGWTYIHLDETEMAKRWLRHSLSLSPQSDEAEIARALIHELNNDYDEAFNSYLKVSSDTLLFPQAMFFLMKAGLRTNRLDEAIQHYRHVYPELFQADARVDSSNFASALALARLLNEKGDSEQHSRYLLNKSLEAAQVEIYGGWSSKENNWKTLIHLAMGDKPAALTAFRDVVNSGIYSNILINDPDYTPLYDEPEFQKLINTMNTRLKNERVKLGEMAARGELNLPEIQAPTP